MSESEESESLHPAREWYEQFELADEYYTGGHFARDPTNGLAHFLNPPEKVIEDARESAEELGLTVAENRNNHGPYETVDIRVFDHTETTLAEIMVEQGIPGRLHEIALYEQYGVQTDNLQSASISEGGGDGS